MAIEHWQLPMDANNEIWCPEQAMAQVLRYSVCGNSQGDKQIRAQKAPRTLASFNLKLWMWKSGAV